MWIWTKYTANLLYRNNKFIMMIEYYNNAYRLPYWNINRKFNESLQGRYIVEFKHDHNGKSSYKIMYVNYNKEISQSIFERTRFRKKFTWDLFFFYIAMIHVGINLALSEKVVTSLQMEILYFLYFCISWSLLFFLLTCILELLYYVVFHILKYFQKR